MSSVLSTMPCHAMPVLPPGVHSVNTAWTTSCYNGSKTLAGSLRLQLLHYIKCTHQVSKYYSQQPFFPRKKRREGGVKNKKHSPNTTELCIDVAAAVVYPTLLSCDDASNNTAFVRCTNDTPSAPYKAFGVYNKKKKLQYLLSNPHHQ